MGPTRDLPRTQYQSPDDEGITLHLTGTREEVLRDLHEGAIAGHLGSDKTFGRLKERFYWPGYNHDVSEWVRKCGQCAMKKTPAPKNRAPLQSVKTGYPMQLVAVDILGPFPESEAHLDSCRLFYTLDGGPNQEAGTVAKNITEEFFFRFSPPEQLHSDQGRLFESVLMAEVCKLLGIHKSRTMPYHPQSDGLVERYNHTLLGMLGTAASANPFSWEDHLHPLCMAYNTSINPTTGFSPSFLMFGRQARMPIDVVYGSPILQKLPPQTMQLTSGRVWNPLTIRCENAWATDWIDRRTCTINESMANHSQKVTWCGFIHQFPGVRLESFTGHGLVLIELCDVFLMQTTAFKMFMFAVAA